MKKYYISPIATEVYVETENLLDGSIPFNDKEVDTEGQLGSTSRGEWGNLWKK